MRKGIVLVLITVAALGAYAAFLIQCDVHIHPPITVMVEKGTSAKMIAERLENLGVIRSRFMFGFLLVLTKSSADLKSGEYRFQGRMDMIDVLKKLKRGEVVYHKITIPEGLRTKEVLKLLARETNTKVEVWFKALEALLPKSQWEGRLLPETYTYILPIDPKRMLGEMIQAQNRYLAALQQPQTWTDPQSLRIIASIIEKETAIPEERPLVAAVIRNRLRRGMPLQMDPTVIYGILQTRGSFSGNLHKRDLQEDTPWNTYTRRGLPPTPICNPGKASLAAAANPADVDYLYFVADGQGGHRFSRDLKEHEKNVRAWIKKEKQQ